MAWQKGQSGNPNGRPKGAKQVLSERFLRRLVVDFKKHGMEAIEKARSEDPVAYVKMIAGLVPKEANVNKHTTHQHTHVSVSETTAFLERAVGGGENVPPEEPRPH